MYLAGSLSLIQFKLVVNQEKSSEMSDGTFQLKAYWYDSFLESAWNMVEQKYKNLTCLSLVWKCFSNVLSKTISSRFAS